MNVMLLLSKKYKRKINKVIKGGSILTILFALIISLVIPPFNIFASTQNIIVPTFSSSSTESTWSSHLHVENYCEGTNASTNSCVLKFTVDDNYYGMIAFDAYNGNTKWIDYQNVFIAGGYGEYHYNFWSSGQVVMNRVNINAISLVLPDSNVDLTQIIQLLTAIEQDTSSIDILVDQTKTQVINVLNQLIISNGYLDTLTKIRQWNFPIESYSYCIYLMYLYDIEYIANTWGYSYYTYPMFNIKVNDVVCNGYFGQGQTYKWIFYMNYYSSNESQLRDTFDIPSNIVIDNVTVLSSPIQEQQGRILSIELHAESNYGNVLIKSKKNIYFVPIFFVKDSEFLYHHCSTEFCLNFGLTNDLLDNLNIIANGTTQTNQSSSTLETQKGTFDTTSNNLYTSENAFNTDMNSKLQSIDTSFNPSTSFGSKFLSSANWVRTQFDNLTSTSPFGTVLSFSMLLGLSLLIIGKVFK